MILTIGFVGLFRGLLSARSGGWRTLEPPQWTAKGKAVSAVQRRWAGLLTRRWTNVRRSIGSAAMFARGQRWCGFRSAHGVIVDSAVGAEQLLFGVQRGPAVAGQLRQLQSWQGTRKCSGDQQVMRLLTVGLHMLCTRTAVRHLKLTIVRDMVSELSVVEKEPQNWTCSIFPITRTWMFIYADNCFVAIPRFNIQTEDEYIWNARAHPSNTYLL